MYKIESYLKSIGMDELKRYPIGTIVYAYRDEDGFFGGVEVSLFPNRRTWDMSITLPFLVCRGEDDNGLSDEDFMKLHIDDWKEHLRSMLELRKDLKKLDDPWSEAE